MRGISSLFYLHSMADTAFGVLKFCVQLAIKINNSYKDAEKGKAEFNELVHLLGLLEPLFESVKKASTETSQNEEFADMSRVTDNFKLIKQMLENHPYAKNT